MEKKLKTILIILIMILICLVGFGGIYTRDKMFFKNKIPNYEFASEIKGTIISTFVLDDSTEEVIYDSEGNKVDSIPEGENEENYKKENIPINSDELKNVDNYRKTKEILEKRLKSLGVSDYDVRIDKDNGNISIELNDNKNADNNLSELLVMGKFEMIDTDDETLLMDTDDLKDAKIYYNNTSSGISVYLTMNFTKEGTKKFDEMTKDYAKISEPEDEKTEENTSEENPEESAAESTEEQAEETTEQKQKTVTINIDGEKFLSTYFSNVIKTGDLTVLVGNASTESDTVTENITAAQHYATILNNGEMPLKYKLQSSEYIQSVYANDLYTYIAIGILLVIAVISILFIIIRFKLLGLLASIIYIATIALITVMIRLTGVEIGIHTIISGIIILFIMDYINYVLLKNINKEDKIDEIKLKINNLYKKIFNVVIIALIPAIVLTYNAALRLSNIGTTLFWGIIIAILMNIIFTKNILLIKIEDKKK